MILEGEQSEITLGGRPSRTMLSCRSPASLFLPELSALSVSALSNAEPRQSQASQDGDTGKRPNERAGPRRPLLLPAPRTGRVEGSPRSAMHGVACIGRSGPIGASSRTASVTVSLVPSEGGSSRCRHRHRRAEQDGEDVTRPQTQRRPHRRIRLTQGKFSDEDERAQSKRVGLYADAWKAEGGRPKD